jgi:RNA polymerase sigma-70 factor (ECF subfamily)
VKLIAWWLDSMATMAAAQGLLASTALGRSPGLAPGLTVDSEDVRRCLGGDGDAYRRIIARHQSMVAAIMWRFSRDPSVHEELVQDVFVEAYESLPRYRGTGPLSHWLARIATRVGYAYWKRERRSRYVVSLSARDVETLADAPADEPVDYAEAAALIHRLLGALPPRDRLVLTLRYVDGLSVERTAEQTGWSKTMVKVQALRARGKLKALVEAAQARGTGEGEGER